MRARLTTAVVGGRGERVRVGMQMMDGRGGMVHPPDAWPPRRRLPHVRWPVQKGKRWKQPDMVPAAGAPMREAGGAPAVFDVTRTHLACPPSATSWPGW